MARLRTRLLFLAPLGVYAIAAIEGGVDDALCLVQRHDASGARRADLGSSEPSGQESFNCTSHPRMCQPPFDCHSIPNVNQTLGPMWWRNGGVGRADLRSWCRAPIYDTFITTCIADQNLTGAGRYMYDVLKEGYPNVFEQDASYCFLEGLCVDEEVTPNTTVEEAEVLCDKRWGSRRWRTYGGPGFDPADDTGSIRFPPPGEGWPGRADSSRYNILACAMGNYHCDVVYCKTTFCQDPHAQAKYSHLLKKNGFVKG